MMRVLSLEAERSMLGLEGALAELVMEVSVYSLFQAGR